MSYKLKPGQENFEMVDGPYAKRMYEKGCAYSVTDIPETEIHRFSEINETQLPLPMAPEAKSGRGVIRMDRAIIKGAKTEEGE